MFAIARIGLYFDNNRASLRISSRRKQRTSNDKKVSKISAFPRNVVTIILHRWTNSLYLLRYVLNKKRIVFRLRFISTCRSATRRFFTAYFGYYWNTRRWWWQNSYICYECFISVQSASNWKRNDNKLNWECRTNENLCRTFITVGQ